MDKSGKTILIIAGVLIFFYLLMSWLTPKPLDWSPTYTTVSGSQDLNPDILPEGVLYPRRIQSGTVAGVQDYVQDQASKS